MPQKYCGKLQQSRVHKRYRQTDRQTTDEWATSCSERECECEFTFTKNED